MLFVMNCQLSLLSLDIPEVRYKDERDVICIWFRSSFVRTPPLVIADADADAVAVAVAVIIKGGEKAEKKISYPSNVP